MIKTSSLAPFGIAVLVGIARVCCDGLETFFIRGHFHYHMYNLAVSHMAASLNRKTFGVAAILCGLWLAFAIARRFKGVLGGICKVIAVVALVLVPIAMTGLFWKLTDQFTGISVLSLARGFGESIPQLAAGLVVLAVGVFLLKRMRRTRSSETKISSIEHPTGNIQHPCDRAVLSAIWDGLLRVGGFLGGRRELTVLPVVLLIGLNLTAVILRSYYAAQAKKNPNIVIIMMDTLRADHLGCYGYSRNTTPNIDRLASHSMRFSKAISQAPWTAPSVGSFMSGRYLRGTYPLTGPLWMGNTPLLSEMLKDRGYVSAGVSSNPQAGSADGFARGWDYYDEYCYRDPTSPDVESIAVSTLERIKGKRFFMFLLFIDAHGPYSLRDKHDMRPAYKGKLGNEVDPPITDQHAAKWSDVDVEYAKALYDSEIAFTDEYIGRFLDRLKRLNLYDDTLVVFIADHGEGFREHGLMDHGNSVYDELLSVPLIIKLPGQKDKRVVEGTFPLINLVPSIMHHLHYDTSALHLQGTAEHLYALKSARPSEILSFLDLGEPWTSPGTVRDTLETVRNDTHCYIRNKSSGREYLFDLRTDKEQSHDIAGENKAIVAAFRKSLAKKVAELNASFSETGQPRIETNTKAYNGDETTRKTLRSLGYLQ